MLLRAQLVHHTISNQKLLHSATAASKHPPRESLYNNSERDKRKDAEITFVYM